MDSFHVNWKNSENYFFVNPRWPLDVQNFFKEKIKNLTDREQIKASLLIPTSGTTAKDLLDTKIVWLKKVAFLEAAQAVGDYFKFSSKDRVAVALPQFHVGGLSQEARQFVWKQELFYFKPAWDAQLFFQFLKDYQITHTSLVPTQLFDLVTAGLQAPSSLKCVFIGAGALGEELRHRAKKLGWPLEITYGMTETSALVAVLEGDQFKVMPHAQMKISENGFLKIKASSLFSGYLKRQGQDLILDLSVLKDGWFTTEDLVEKTSEGFKILGRTKDYAKISGEGVYLGRLQVLLQDSCLQAGLTAFDQVILYFNDSDRLGSEVHLLSTLSEVEIQPVVGIFNQKVLPFERIRGFHQVQEIPKTELGKVRWQEIK